MKYIRLKDLEQHEQNPFIEKAISQIKTVRKTKHYSPTSKNEMQMIVNRETGEQTGETAFIKFVEVDEEKFAKVYLSQFSAFYELSKSAIKLFGYILNELKPNSDFFYFDIDDAMAVTGYKGKNTIIAALASLVKNSIIARSNKHYMYFINPMVVFNGNRITFAKSYVKKKKGDPNQLMLDLEDKKELPPPEN